MTHKKALKYLKNIFIFIQVNCYGKRIRWNQKKEHFPFNTEDILTKPACKVLEFDHKEMKEDITKNRISSGLKNSNLQWIQTFAPYFLRGYLRITRKIRKKNPNTAIIARPDRCPCPFEFYNPLGL